MQVLFIIFHNNHCFMIFVFMTGIIIPNNNQKTRMGVRPGERQMDKTL